mmetsp:Transcript_47/g.78  ORF Transcript_47/g.78 Transcript_47/m.78 type:complete len:95 (-) Transcript_47:831-1115(-)
MPPQMIANSTKNTCMTGMMNMGGNFSRLESRRCNQYDTMISHVASMKYKYQKANSFLSPRLVDSNNNANDFEFRTACVPMTAEDTAKQNGSTNA